MADINITMADDQPIHIVMDDEQPIDITITDAFPISSSSNHNDLSNIQGGAIDEYYHLLAAEYTELNAWLDDVTLGSNGVTSIPQLVLVPSAAAVEAIEGGIFYNSADKSLYVCTDV